MTLRRISVNLFAAAAIALLAPFANFGGGLADSGLGGSPAGAHGARVVADTGWGGAARCTTCGH
jgi:hypothetical protein